MLFTKPDSMPQEAYDVWVNVYKRYSDKSEDEASKLAWDSVKEGWDKQSGTWNKKEITDHKVFHGIVTDLNNVTTSDNSSVIEVFRTGHWNHPYYGEIDMTNERLARFKENFDNHVIKVDIAVDRDHNPGNGAVGWFKQLYHEILSDGTGVLKALVEWNDDGITDIQKKRYRYFSADMWDEYERAADGEIFQDVLVGGGITNRPFFQELREVTLSDQRPFMTFSMTKFVKGGDNNMAKLTVDQLKAKLKEDPTFKPTAEEASAEELKAAQDALTAEAAAEEGKGEGEGGDGDGDKAGADKGGDSQTHSDKSKGKTYNLSEAEFKSLKFAAEAGATAAKELKKSQIYSTIEGLTFNSETKKGVLLPKDAEKAKKFALTLGENQRQMFFDLLSNLPTPEKLFSEVGKDAGEGENFDGNLNPNEELNKRTQKLFSEQPEKYKTYRDAAYEVERQMKAEGKKL